MTIWLTSACCMVIILAIIGLGWTTFYSGVITGLEKVADIGAPIIKNLTREVKENANNPELSVTR